MKLNINIQHIVKGSLSAKGKPGDTLLSVTKDISQEATELIDRLSQEMYMNEHYSSMLFLSNSDRMLIAHVQGSYVQHPEYSRVYDTRVVYEINKERFKSTGYNHKLLLPGLTAMRFYDESNYNADSMVEIKGQCTKLNIQEQEVLKQLLKQITLCMANAQPLIIKIGYEEDAFNNHIINSKHLATLLVTIGTMPAEDRQKISFAYSVNSAFQELLAERICNVIVTHDEPQLWNNPYYNNARTCIWDDNGLSETTTTKTDSTQADDTQNPETGLEGDEDNFNNNLITETTMTNKENFNETHQAEAVTRQPESAKGGKAIIVAALLLIALLTGLTLLAPKAKAASSKSALIDTTMVVSNAELFKYQNGYTYKTDRWVNIEVEKPQEATEQLQDSFCLWIQDKCLSPLITIPDDTLSLPLDIDKMMEEMIIQRCDSDYEEGRVSLIVHKVYETDSCISFVADVWWAEGIVGRKIVEMATFLKSTGEILDFNKIFNSKVAKYDPNEESVEYKAKFRKHKEFMNLLSLYDVSLDDDMYAAEKLSRACLTYHGVMFGYDVEHAQPLHNSLITVPYKQISPFLSDKAKRLIQ